MQKILLVVEIFCACSVNVLREEEGLRREGLETRLVSVKLEKVRRNSKR